MSFLINLMLFSVICELGCCKYLLLELKNGSIESQSMGNFSGAPEIKPRIPDPLRRAKCWTCIKEECKKKDKPSLTPLIRFCTDFYVNPNIYPTTKELVECAVERCRKARNEIEFDCKDGGLGGIPYGGPCFYEE